MRNDMAAALARKKALGITDPVERREQLAAQLNAAIDSGDFASFAAAKALYEQACKGSEEEPSTVCRDCGAESPNGLTPCLGCRP